MSGNIKSTKFYLVHSFGYYACALMDLGEGHTFRKEIGKDKLSDFVTVELYTSLESMPKILLKDAKAASAIPVLRPAALVITPSGVWGSTSGAVG